MQIARNIKSFLGFKTKKKLELVDNDEHKIVEYKIGKYKIFFAKSHMLQKYQIMFPLYDRFLPIICSHFSGLIIDVGANIGDTSLQIFEKNVNSFIVGVEPDNEFANECQKNIDFNGLSDRFFLVRKFLSTKKGNFIIEKNDSNSTGSISLVESDISDILEDNTISFLELFNTIPENKKQTFDMLKIDTDGFDFDVLNSFSDYAKISKLLPKYIFFEMQTFINNEGYKNENREQILKDYIQSIEKIFDLGYTNFCLFDNFGTYIKLTNSLTEIEEFSKYMIRSQTKNNYSTIYHLDILAYKESESTLVNNVLVQYCKL